MELFNGHETFAGSGGVDTIVSEPRDILSELNQIEANSGDESAASRELEQQKRRKQQYALEMRALDDQLRQRQLEIAREERLWIQKQKMAEMAARSHDADQLESQDSAARSTSDYESKRRMAVVLVFLVTALAIGYKTIH